MLSVLLISIISFAQVDGTQQLATKIVELRQETESLKSEYDLYKSELESDIKSLITQKAEVEAGLNDIHLREQQVQAKISSLKRDVKQSSVLGNDLALLNASAIENLKTYIFTSVPFRLRERIETLEKLKVGIEKQEISNSKATTLLWSLMEDEKRLARETSMAKQNVSVGGREVLAEVLHLGMIALYFKIDDKTYGQVTRKNEEWFYEPFDDKDSISSVKVLFDDQKKQVRNGFYTLPMPVTSEGV